MLNYPIPTTEFNFRKGTLLDSRGELILTNSNNTSFIDRSIINGKALQFDGSSQYLTVTDPLALNITTQNFSIAAWVRNTNPASYNFVVAKGGNTGTAQGYVFYANASYWLFDVSDGVDVVEVYTSITANAWSFVVATVDAGDSASIFLNGVFKQSASLTAVGSLTCPARPFTVGKRENGGNYYFPGDQAWLAFWDGVALTTAEQLALYNAMNKGSLITPRPPIWAL